MGSIRLLFQYPFLIASSTISYIFSSMHSNPTPAYLDFRSSIGIGG